MRSHVMVVGAGAAGSAAAVAVRQGAEQAGLDVAVTVLGAEDRLPYNRTTVNKGLLSGAVDDAAIALPGMAGVGVDWRLGSVAETLEPRRPAVRLGDGTRLESEAVVLATGAVPRELPAPTEEAATSRVVRLRDAADTHRLKALLERDRRRGSRRVVVAGAGLIGTEVTAVLQGLGFDVTLVDPSPEPLARQVGATVAAWVAAAHRAAAVDLRLQTRIAGVRAADAGVQVDLDDGNSIGAVAVVACLGVQPATAWLTGSGLPLQENGAATGGIVVDAAHRVVGFPGVYAVGDLAAITGPDGSLVRVEHWGAALAQGRIAARGVLADLGVPAPAGAPEPAQGVPSYSTYVHATKLTILGWPVASAGERPVLGRPGDPRFAVALLDAADRVVGAVGVGGAKAANALRPLIERRAPAGELELATTGR